MNSPLVRPTKPIAWAAWLPALVGIVLGPLVPGLGGILLAWAGLTISAWGWVRWTAASGLDHGFESLTDQEGWFLGVVLLLGLGLRVVDALFFFEGVYDDRAGVALGALRILHEGWRPWAQIQNLQVAEPFSYYALAFWFSIFGDSVRSLGWFDVFLWGISVPIWYSVFRRLGGIPTAQLALVFYATSRWGITYTGHHNFSIMVFVFLGLTLEAWSRGLARGRHGWFALAGFWAGAGCYAYKPLKATLVLLTFLILWEGWNQREWRRAGKRGAWMLGGWVSATAPLLFQGFLTGEAGRRESELWIFNAATGGKGWTELLHNFVSTLGMFYAQGDPMANHNLWGLPELDPVTGVLAAWGLAWALKRIRSWEGFVPLAGLLVMALPMVLSQGCPNNMRSLGMLPFVCFLAGGALDSTLQWLKPTSGRPARRVLAWGILSASILWNVVAYFGFQVQQDGWKNSFNRGETELGEWLNREPRGTQVGLSGPFAYHSTIRYKTYSLRDRIAPLDTDRLPEAPAVFILDPLQGGLADYLRLYYPGGTLETLSGSGMGPIALVYRTGGVGAPPRTGVRGLWRIGTGSPMGRWDPVVDFAWRDLPFPNGMKDFVWEGSLRVEGSGPHRFQILCGPNAEASMEMDGKPVGLLASDPGGQVSLRRGQHSVRLRLKVPGGGLFFMHLLWKTPGSDRFEAVPNRVFGIRK